MRGRLPVRGRARVDEARAGEQAEVPADRVLVQREPDRKRANVQALDRPAQLLDDARAVRVGQRLPDGELAHLHEIYR